MPSKGDTLKDNSQLSEEHLFQLLINKVKVREENELAASKIREQMQLLVTELAEENDFLRENLDACKTNLHRREAELNSQRLRMETWKANLTKFRGFLNEFGADFRVLRGEAIQLKATRTYLDKEKKEIEGSIACAKEHISQISGRLDEGRSGLSEMVRTTNLLQQNLTNNEERERISQEQLIHERRRSSALESYIQQQTSAQSKRLGLVVSNQLAIMTTLDSSFHKVGSQLDSIHSSTQAIIGNALDKCLVSLNKLNESHFAGLIDVQRVEEFTKEFTAR